MPVRVYSPFDCFENGNVKAYLSLNMQEEGEGSVQVRPYF
jgi:hypothetical protein